MSDPKPTGRQGDCRKEIPCELVVARGDASEMLEFVEEAFDQVTLSIELMVNGSLVFAVALGGDVRPRAVFGDQLEDGLGVISLVADGIVSGTQALEQCRDGRLVGRLPRRQQKSDRQATGIDDGMDLGAQSSTRTADGVIRAPFFPPAAC